MCWIPPVGQAGFVVCARLHSPSGHRVLRKGSADHYRYWHDFAEKHLYGIEINDEIARVAKMNMIVHDDGHTNVISYDALESIDKIAKT